MECHNHPDREAVANCAFCGKAVCPECSMGFGEKETLAKKPAAEIEEPADNFEPIEPITPIQSEEREAEEEALKIVEKAPENFETDYEYETEYVETYEEDGAEDSYYE